MTAQPDAFNTEVLHYYRAFGRHDLPWRQPDTDGFSPYKIMVSELMLQQTQVARVIDKYQQFLARFPTAEALAAAPLKDVLAIWVGLGYNRRAQYLQRAAQAVLTEFSGQFPADQTELTKLPGVGVNTAGAICAYAYNQPVIFVETNIRTVIIHHFFPGEQAVSDKAILKVVAATLTDNPREWYWALMDYGTYLKQSADNAARRSSTYARQSKFEGSRRQVRGRVIKILAAGPQNLDQLSAQIADERLESVLAALVNEQMVTVSQGRFSL